MEKVKKWLLGILSVFGVTFGGDVVIQNEKCGNEIEEFQNKIEKGITKSDLLFYIKNEDCRYFDSTTKKKQIVHENVVIDGDDVLYGIKEDDKVGIIFDNYTDLLKAREHYKIPDSELKGRLKKDKVNTFNIINKQLE